MPVDWRARGNLTNPGLGETAQRTGACSEPTLRFLSVCFGDATFNRGHAHPEGSRLVDPDEEFLPPAWLLGGLEHIFRNSNEFCPDDSFALHSGLTSVVAILQDGIVLDERISQEEAKTITVSQPPTYAQCHFSPSSTGGTGYTYPSLHSLGDCIVVGVFCVFCMWLMLLLSWNRFPLNLRLSLSFR